MGVDILSQGLDCSCFPSVAFSSYHQDTWEVIGFFGELDHRVKKELGHGEVQ